VKVIFKIPKESADYDKSSDYVVGRISTIIADSIACGNNQIFIRTNLKRGLPLENINKVAGPFVEAWALEQFENIADDLDNKYQLMYLNFRRFQAAQAARFRYFSRSSSN